MEAWIGKARELAWAYGPQAMAALITLILGWIVARIATGILRGILVRAKLDPVLVNFLSKMAHALLLTMVVLAGVQRLGVETTSAIALLGAAGLAVGLALQGTLGHFAAGVMLILFRPFKPGDTVEVAGIVGTIEEIGIFATTLRTGDNRKIILPNGAVYGSSIVNYSAKETRRVDLVFGIGYGDDLRKAKEILESMLAADQRILKDPAPVVAVLELADSSVNLAVRPWVKSADYWAVRFDLLENVKLKFDASGISIPFPQRDVHLIKEEAA